MLCFPPGLGDPKPDCGELVLDGLYIGFDDGICGEMGLEGSVLVSRKEAKSVNG